MIYLSAQQAKRKTDSFVPNMTLVQKYRKMFERKIEDACDAGNYGCVFSLFFLTLKRQAAINFVVEEFKQLGYDISFFENIISIRWDGEE